MLHTLSLTAAADQIHDGSLRSVDLVRACLDRVERVDSDIDAWVLFDGQRRSWPDIASKTETVVLPKK